MIRKIKTIKNFSIFKEFDWDKEVIDKENNIKEFTEINIIYGRNYSGKTTLSRIIRAMETGLISDKYDNPEFCVKIKDENDVTEDLLKSHNKTFRVYNEDFISDNLKFIIDPEENIQAFAIFGDTGDLETKINNLKVKLGSQKEGKETGLYKDLKYLEQSYNSAETTYKSAFNNLEGQLKHKAIDKSNGIKYKSEIYGDQNYTTTKLKNEMSIVLSNAYIAINKEDKEKAEKLITETKNEPISKLPELKLEFEDLLNTAKDLVTKKIGRSDKIAELVKDAILNRWVKDGKNLHQDKRKICAFCNNEISDQRWKELDRHFDEESNKLENEIDNLITEIADEKKQINTMTYYKKEQFYSEYQEDFNAQSKEYLSFIAKYMASLDILEKQLVTRKNDLLNEKEFNAPEDYSGDIFSQRSKIESLREKSDDFTKGLDTKQKKAKKSLRLNEIYNFTQSIKYYEQITSIQVLKKKMENHLKNKKEKHDEINEIKNEIDAYQKQQKDERKGAEKVRELLGNFFGHKFLNIDAVEIVDEITGNKRFVFEIQRDGKKAYHLSEGEKSLISFCYFIAKLEDIETESKKPLIWIDDPISSLDNNHIFFLYSLIKSKIIDRNDFEQIFITTHNLNFLKYLKRLKGGFINANSKFQEYSKCYFIVSRNDKNATLKLMPDYLKEYITEFNYLFHQIYKCSQMDEITDENYTIFYNFGNNARKFLEIYLFYKYPDSSDDMVKYKKFFGEDDIPAVLTNRFDNEYSHLCSAVERGAMPIEVPEMKKVADKIIEKLKEKDSDQYVALEKSIGVTA